MLDSSDDNSSVSSSSTGRSDLMSVSGSDDVQVDKDSLLEQALDALYEKRFVSGFYFIFYAHVCDQCMLNWWFCCFFFFFVCIKGFDKRESFGSDYWGFQYQFAAPICWEKVTTCICRKN